MGNANRNPYFQELEFAGYETKRWKEVHKILNGNLKRDFNVETYINSRLSEAEEKWSQIRRKRGVQHFTRREVAQLTNELERQKLEINRLTTQNRCLEREHMDMKKKISKLEKDNQELNSRNRRGMEKNRTENQGHTSQDTKRNQRSDDTDQKVARLQMQIARLEEEKQELKAKNQSLHMHVKQVEDEKSNLLLRLSKVAGERLMNNNPAITDLSDQNRPTKLAELYSEIYDNEWTSAFEILQASGYDEETAVETLRLTLLNVIKFCEMKAQRVLKQAADAVNLLFQEYKESVTIKDVPAHLTMQRQPIKRRRNLAAVFEQEVKLPLRWKPKSHQDSVAHDLKKKMQKSEMDKIKKDLKLTAEPKLIQLRKEVAMSMVPIVQQAYIDASWSPDCLEEIKDFLMRCLFLGWMMVVQDPPLVLGPSEADIKFDKNLYKEYTRSGGAVDFVVWPALLLHENGTVICKGVAQAKKS